MPVVSAKEGSRAIRRLAWLGGTPAFTEPVPITRPTLPPYADVAPAFRRAISSGMITRSTYLRELETLVEKHTGARCVAVSSCTVGLVLSLQALRVDGEVIVPSFTFLASASAPALLRLPLRFVDVDAETWTIDPRAVEAAIGPRTAAVLAVHTFGVPAELDVLGEICRRRGLALIVDAAHGLGALRNGRPIGAGGDAEVFSMSPTKLVAAGEGGLVTTKRQDVAAQLEALREYGNAGDYVTIQPGLNGRLDEFSAILAIAGFGKLEANARRRNRLVELAKAELSGVPGVRWQAVRNGDRSSYKDFAILVSPSEYGMDRDLLARVLAAERIDTRKYFAPLVHRHPAFEGSAVEDLPVSERLEAQALSLPLYSHMPASTMRTIARTVALAQREAARVAGRGEGSSRVA